MTIPKKKRKKNLDLTRWYFESVAKRLIVQSRVVAPLISLLEKERKLGLYKTSHFKTNFRRIKYYNLGKVKPKEK